MTKKKKSVVGLENEVRDAMPLEVKDVFDKIKDAAKELAFAKTGKNDWTTDQIIAKASYIANLKPFLSGYKNHVGYLHDKLKWDIDQKERTAIAQSRRASKSIADSERLAEDKVWKKRKDELELEAAYRFLRDFLRDVEQGITVSQTRVGNIRSEKFEANLPTPR